VDVKVQKRDKQVEPWDHQKLTSSMMNAGLDSQDSEYAAYLVKGWARRSGKDPLPSTEVRVKVLGLLGLVHPQAAYTYEGFSKAR
jgi:hypothetical protein